MTPDRPRGPRSKLIVLIGPKGSGKSTIGRALARRHGVTFVDVEAISRSILSARRGVVDADYAKAVFAATVDKLSSLSRDHGLMVMETTGASDQTRQYLDDLAAHHELLLVRIRASANVCRGRIAARDASVHAPVPAELVAEMHRRSEALQLDCDLEFRNDADGNVEAIADAIALAAAS